MADVIEQQEKQLDAAAFIKARNEGLPKPVDRVDPPKVDNPEPKVDKSAAESTQSIKVPRHIRRENNRLREEASELRGQLAAYKALGVKPNGEPDKPKGETDPEPKQADFASEIEYNRALGRWEGRQGAKEAIGKHEEQTKAETDRARLEAHVQEMDTKAEADVKLIPDWDEVAKAAEEDEDAPRINFEHDKLLWGLILHSDVRAFMLHHFAKVPADLQKMINLRSDNDGLISAFKRLEGRVEVEYSKSTEKEAAEASDKSKVTKPKDEAKDRSPENTEQARANPKPKPSTEVAARGGSAPPEEPPIGSKAWMEKRNAMTGGR